MENGCTIPISGLSQGRLSREFLGKEDTWKAVGGVLEVVLSARCVSRGRHLAHPLSANVPSIHKWATCSILSTLPACAVTPLLRFARVALQRCLTGWDESNEHIAHSYCTDLVCSPNPSRLTLQIRAADPQCRLVATDWYQSNKRIDHVATREGGVVQAASGRELFLFVVNMQVSGITRYRMMFFYFAHNLPLSPASTCSTAPCMGTTSSTTTGSSSFPSFQRWVFSVCL